MKGLPSKLWNAKALPENRCDPALNGDSVNCFITDAANLPSSTDVFNGSAIIDEFDTRLYLCNITTPMGVDLQ